MRPCPVAGPQCGFVTREGLAGQCVKKTGHNQAPTQRELRSREKPWLWSLREGCGGGSLGGMEEKLVLESPGTGAVQALLNVTEGGDDRGGWHKMAEEDSTG